MRHEEGRRLTGANLWLDGPGAAAEVLLAPDDDRDAVIAAVKGEVRAVFERAGLEAADVVVRPHARGLSVAVPAPVDALYASVSALEHALDVVVARGEGRAPTDDERAQALAAVDEERRQEANPRLLALLSAARARGVPALWDDDEVSVGLGARSFTWASRALPAPDDVEWDALGAIPVATVTGTNGKTTTTRLIARMLGAAGHVAGHTSTDGLVVGSELVDEGDWSGPGGARALLRDPRVTAAVLETARGGLLRRGLAYERSDVALVTNVGADHLGEYGVLDVERMADVKLLVARGLKPGGTLVLNGGDATLLAGAARLALADGAARRVLFAVRPDEPAVVEHQRRGGVAWVVDGDALTRVAAGERRPLLPVHEVPLAYGGAARHNVENALAAAAVGDALGLPWDALASGLRSLRPTPKDSPGRSNVLTRDGVRLLLDFAHNPAGVAVTMSFLAALRARDTPRGRLIVLVGQAGDRSDEDVRAFARGVVEGGADVVIARDLTGYLRGRAPGENPAVFRRELLRLGLPERAVRTAEDDVAALSLALDEARAGDTVALLVQVDSEGVHELLRERGWDLEGEAAHFLISI